MLSEIANVLFSGMVDGVLYAGVALGLTMTFGLMGTINFAHGQMMALGGYIAFWCISSGGTNFWAAVAISALGVALVGWAIERTTFRFARGDPITGSGAINGLIMSFGLVAIIQNVILHFWQSTPRVISPPLERVFRIGDASFPAQALATLVILAGLMAAFVWLLRSSRVGASLRATGINRDAAETVGINTDRFVSLSFAVGAGLAGLVGSLWGALFVVTPFMGDDPLVKGFVIVVLGGLGSVPGAIIGGILLGMVDSLGVWLTSSTWQPAFAFGIMLLILAVRPQGLFPTRHGV